MSSYSDYRERVLGGYSDATIVAEQSLAGMGAAYVAAWLTSAEETAREGSDLSAAECAPHTARALAGLIVAAETAD